MHRAFSGHEAFLRDAAWLQRRNFSPAAFVMRLCIRDSKPHAAKDFSIPDQR
jgi:hypothetical protein